MQLIDHVSVTVRDLHSVKPFYKAIMGVIGAVVVYEQDDAIGFGERNRPNDDNHTYISIFQSVHASPDPRRHWCFRARSIDEVLAFYRAGIASGGIDEGVPGLRTYHPQYYAAFLLDPEGNKVEAVFHQAEASPFS
jgi:catechol 2,3-dioxygenase-like lactoylglutathione lyase family enzyme